MIYLDYERYKLRYLEIEKIYNKILTEKEELFVRTQPKGLNYDKDNVQGGTPVNMIDEYVIAVELKGLDEKLKHASQLLEERQVLLENKEKELKKSQNVVDQIYYKHYIKGIKIPQIAISLNYSESQVYRILQKINYEISKHARKCEKIMV